MSLGDVSDWIDEFVFKSEFCYAKILSANDTLATGGHQAGPYFPKSYVFEIFPEINTQQEKNPRLQFDLFIDSHADCKEVTAIYYNNKFFDGTRNEARLTNFGGASSALLNPESTGSLAVFAFVRNSLEKLECHVWVCDHSTETELFESYLGPVEPKSDVFLKNGQPQVHNLFAVANNSCWLQSHEIPDAWLASFPTGREIIAKAVERRPLLGRDVDVRLLKRRECEFEIFKSVEEATFLPKIKQGFGDIGSFLDLAQSILQSRKSRSGRSLEYHTLALFEEEGLVSGANFEHGITIETNKKPDFIFPSKAHYEDQSYPSSKLRMLAAKTTCKDRWRQILNEASRIEHKHLLTLQEGVSENQFKEMVEAKVTLVVPKGLHKSYPENIRPHLLTLEEFIGDTRLLIT